MRARENPASELEIPYVSLSILHEAKPLSKDLEIAACIQILENALRSQRSAIWTARILVLGGLAWCLYLAVQHFTQTEMQIGENKQIQSARSDILQRFTGQESIIPNWHVYTNCANSNYLTPAYEAMQNGECPKDQYPSFSPCKVWNTGPCCEKMIAEFCKLPPLHTKTTEYLIGFGIGITVTGMVILGELIKGILTEIAQQFSLPRLYGIPIRKNFLTKDQLEQLHVAAEKYNIIFIEHDLRKTLENFKDAYQKVAAPLAFLSASQTPESPLQVLFNDKNLRAPLLTKNIFQMAGLFPTDEVKQEKRKASRIAFLSCDKNREPIGKFFAELQQKDRLDNNRYEFNRYHDSQGILEEIFEFANIAKVRK